MTCIVEGNKVVDLIEGISLEEAFAGISFLRALKDAIRQLESTDIITIGGLSKIIFQNEVESQNHLRKLGV